MTLARTAKLLLLTLLTSLLLLGAEHAPEGGWAQLHWLAVRRDWRQRGIARALVEWASQQAGQAGCVELRADTLRSWQASVRFYQALGFRERC